MSSESPVVQVSLKDTVGGAAQRAREHLHGGPSREAVGTVVVSAVGAAIAMAAKATEVLTKEGSAKVTKLSTDVVKVEAGEAGAIQRLQVVLDASQQFVAGETPVPEELKGEKMAKKLAKVVKEGGKRGVEIEGAADMGGLQFFCTAVELPGANLKLLYESMRAMNARCDPSEEERKGGSSAVGKLLCSATDESAVTVMTYVPKVKNEHIKADEWLLAVLKEAAPKAKLEFASSTHAGVTLKMGKEQGLFSIKVKDALIQGGISHLRNKGLFPDGDDDDSDEMIFGDDFDVDAC